MRLTEYRIGLAVLIAAGAVASGLLYSAPDDLDDLTSVSDGLIALTETEVAAIAADLDADAVEAKLCRSTDHDTVGGAANELEIVEVDLYVEITLNGSEPTQEQLIEALERIGLVDVEGSVKDESSRIRAEGFTSDGNTSVSVSYGTRYPDTENEFTGYSISVSAERAPLVSGADFEAWSKIDYTINVARLNRAIKASG